MENMSFNGIVTTKWVKENLVNATYEVKKKMEMIVKIEHTGLHELEFIETRRYTINNDSFHKTHGTVNMLNLIDGRVPLLKVTLNHSLCIMQKPSLFTASIKDIQSSLMI